MDNTRLRNYLLGTLDDVEEERVEEFLRQTDMNISQLSIIEDELVDDYISGQMSAVDRERFETFFLLDPARAQKLRFGKILHSFLARASHKDQQESDSEQDPLDEGDTSPSYPEQQASVRSPGFHRMSKIAMIVGLASILIFGSLVLTRIQTLRNQIESLQRREEQLRVRVLKIEKNLNLDDENNGSAFRNSSNSVEDLRTAHANDYEYTIASCKNMTGG